VTKTPKVTKVIHWPGGPLEPCYFPGFYDLWDGVRAVPLDALAAQTGRTPQELEALIDELNLPLRVVEVLPLTHTPTKR
jgi:hypothetical protein